MDKEIGNDDINRLYDKMDNRFEVTEERIEKNMKSLCTKLKLYTDNAILLHQRDCYQRSNKRKLKDKKEELAALAIAIGSALMVVGKFLLS